MTDQRTEKAESTQAAATLSQIQTVANTIPEFSLQLEERKLKLDGEVYTLRELAGTGRGKYLTGIASRLVINPDTGKPVSMKNFDGLETSLLRLCLYGPDGSLVPEDIMQKWPSSVLAKLFEMALELAGLGELGRQKKEAEAKNACGEKT